MPCLRDPATSASTLVFRINIYFGINIQCNLNSVTLNLVTTCDLVTILQRPFFNLLHEIIIFSDIMQRPKVSLNSDCTVTQFVALVKTIKSQKIARLVK